ncbi:MAG: Lrp/AsnC family transcriptional regulator [Candidatus Thorarchaeota archaeon]|nr:Lrp/AsnC family transcriptional regulator [Candidatus Thorarchaeota archaeon]
MAYQGGGLSISLSQIDLKLLQIIELNPTISIQELAKKTGVSWITANRHLQQLRDAQVLSDPVAVFNPDKLGLERYIVLLRAKTERSIEVLEVACDVHPYTHYRSRTYGPYTGLFAQFDIPPDGRDNLQRFLEGLCKLDMCEIVDARRGTSFRTSTKTNLELFDSMTMTWDYDWTEWSHDISTVSDREELSSFTASEIPLLTPVDLRILQELTANANVNQTHLQKKLSLSQSSVSRKVIALTQNYIESVRAQIDRSRFDVTSTKMFFCPHAEDSIRNKLFNAFSLETAPPFPISIDLLEEHGVLLWGRMPPSHEHKLFYTLWKFLPELQVFTMDTVRNHSRLYWFYPDNFDADRKRWRSDKHWMIEQPMQSLKEKYGLL